MLKAFFKPGYRYRKCGVQLSQIQSAKLPDQADVFEFAACNADDRDNLMQALDQINRRFPKSTCIAETAFDQL